LDLGFVVGVALALAFLLLLLLLLCVSIVLSLFNFFLCLGWAWAIGTFDRSRVVESFVVFFGWDFLCATAGI